MATSSITKEFSFNTKEEVDALFDAIERSAQQQGIDLDEEVVVREYRNTTGIK